MALVGIRGGIDAQQRCKISQAGSGRAAVRAHPRFVRSDRFRSRSLYVLEVRGRKTGRVVSLPVDPIEISGKWYLVCARGESNWVRNTRSAGEVVLMRAMRRRQFAVREPPPNLRPPILKAYLDKFAAEVQRFFPVPKGSPVEAFDALAPRYPVFELQPLNDATPFARAAAR